MNNLRLRCENCGDPVKFISGLESLIVKDKDLVCKVSLCGCKSRVLKRAMINEFERILKSVVPSAITHTMLYDLTSQCMDQAIEKAEEQINEERAAQKIKGDD